MSSALPFCYSIEEALSLMKSKLNPFNITFTKETDVNNGVGTKLVGSCNGQPVSMVLYFNKSKGISTKIVIEKFPESELNLLQDILKQEEGSVKQKSIPIYATITIIDPVQRQIIKSALEKADLGFTENDKSDHMDYTAKLLKNGETLTITQFQTGALLIQGAYTSLVDSIISIIENIQPLTMQERALFFLPADTQKELQNEITTKTQLIEQELPKNIKSNQEWIEYLHANDHKTFLTGNALIEILEAQTKILPEYNFLVAIFAKVYEGFLIKLLIDKNFCTESQFQENPRILNIGNALRSRKLEKYIKDKERNNYINGKLLSVWEGTRCKEMHSDPYENISIISVDSLEAAKDKIGEIKTCINEGYGILIKNGWNDATIPQNLISKKPEQPKKNTEKKLDEIKSSIYIGTDESGKGDYFGPLVIAGVCLDPSFEEKLSLAGIKDSKKISDNRIYDYAKLIRNYLPQTHYSVIMIGPEKYNELYNKIGNLNKLLAWGHARAIENILSTVNCEKAIADQFGDELYIKNALMEKGKEIELVQMPKAEKYIAVAAASILARETFLIRLEELGKYAKIQLHKGASQQVITAAREIIKKNGFNSLNKFAKLHFKTTESLR